MKNIRFLLYFLTLSFTACIAPKNKVKDNETYTPMNPVVVYMHKDQLMLKGAVKEVDKNERYDRDGNMTSNFGDSLIHSKDKIIHKLGATTTTYLKDENGRIYKALLDELGENVTNYTYNTQGLLATEYGTEERIDYNTTYSYDAAGRVTKSSYTYGEDPIVNIYYAYKDVENDKLQITISYDEQDAQEIYEYTNGYMTAHTQYGKKTTYTYTWDNQGNWISQTVSDGGTTQRKITYYE